MDRWPFRKNQMDRLRAKIAQYYSHVVDGMELLSTLASISSIFYSVVCVNQSLLMRMALSIPLRYKTRGDVPTLL